MGQVSCGQLQLDLARSLERPEPRGAEGSLLGRAVLRALARDQAAADALRAMYRELHVAFDLSGAGAARLSRRCFHRWLLDAAADFNLDPRGPRAGAVRVLDLRQVAGRSFAHLCVGGLTDDRLPGRDPPSRRRPPASLRHTLQTTLVKPSAGIPHGSGRPTVTGRLAFEPGPLPSTPLPRWGGRRSQDGCCSGPGGGEIPIATRVPTSPAASGSFNEQFPVDPRSVEAMRAFGGVGDRESLEASALPAIRRSNARSAESGPCPYRQPPFTTPTSEHCCPPCITTKVECRMSWCGRNLPI